MRKEAVLWKKDNNDMVLCHLCSHMCKIQNNKFGFCGVRQNIDGILYTYAYGKVIANHVDPIEKKPLYHFIPGTKSYSIATAGCNFRCAFCQNWSISQLGVSGEDLEGTEISASEVVKEAIKNNCKSISYTYTEPTIFMEYAHDIAKEAKNKNLYNIFVTNGYMTKEAVDFISPYLDAANIDLKFFNDKTYAQMCQGHLDPVLASIKYMKEKKIWVEITTLIIPGKNDSDEELKKIAEFIAGVNTDIPWHISRFHPDYKYLEAEVTSVETIQKAAEIGKKAGLNYIYPGNVSLETNTICPGCGDVIINRSFYAGKVSENLDTEGKCASCRMHIDGVWR